MTILWRGHARDGFPASTARAFRVRDMLRLVDKAEVAAVFLKGGYRALERHYSPDNEVVMMLIEHAGGDALRRQRAAMQPCGRKCGGRRA